MDYIRSLDKSDSDRCFLCDAAAATEDAEKRERLVLWTTPQTVVLINRYPYTNGHLLIAPREHTPDLEVLAEEVAFDLHRQTMRAIKLLKRAMSPQGFNIGINQGRCAGAGLPGHVHQHVVPRWGGDTNFITVVGEVRVVPQAMSQLHAELTRCLTQMDA
jgi:ATP adenylyltransferase